MWSYKFSEFSIPMTSGLPYGIFMKQVIFDITNSGQLNQINTKWNRLTQRDCTPLIRKGKPLSIEKLISLFFIPVLGFLLALIIAFFEFCVEKIQGKKATKDQVVPEELIIESLRIILREVKDLDWHNCTLTFMNAKNAELKKISDLLQK